MTFRRGGTRRASVTLRSSPRQRARIVGRVWVARGADHVRVQDLDLDGRNRTGLPSPTVNAAHVRFEGNDVTNRHTAICFVLGGAEYGLAIGTVLKRNRIHDCGTLPANNHEHGVYLAHSRAVSIVDNLIYDNADRGIQLYPDAQRTLIRNNVIDGNGVGVIFSGDEGLASSGNHVEGNVITNSRIRNNVESYYPEGHPVGRNNVARRNCIQGGARDFGPPWPGGIGTQVGFRAIDNLTADPRFVSRSRADFRLQGASPCRTLVQAGRWPPAH